MGFSINQFDLFLLLPGLCLVFLITSCTETEVATMINSDITASKNDSGIFGDVIAQSDVATIPDAPVQAIVLAVSDSLFPELVHRLGKVPQESYDLFEAILEEDLVNPFIKGHARSNAKGDFKIPLKSGAYRLCLGNVYQQGNEALFPAIIRGCTDPIAVSNNEWHRTRICFTFGIVQVCK